LNVIRLKIQDLFLKKLKQKIKKYQPDYIVFTHPVAAEYFNRYSSLKDGGIKYAVIITDFYAHKLWYQKNIDLFFVASRELKQSLIEYNFDEDKIHITGIPVGHRFSKKLNKEASRVSLDLKPEILTILVMSGAHGIGRIDKSINYLFKNIDIDFQIIALAGSNNRLFNKIKQLESVYSKKLKGITFTDEVDIYMAASDFIITKAGGLSISECLCYGLPVITLKAIPGQEEQNIDYLVKKDAGIKVTTLDDLKKTVFNFLEDSELLNSMQINAKKLSKPNSSYNILKILTE
jgi:processive 1,2-diacylglycerol beta-glucosyltransferase